MTLGFVVSEREIYQSLIDATNNISEATARILNYQLIAFCVSIFVVFVAVYAISGRITKGLSQLAAAARALQNRTIRFALLFRPATKLRPWGLRLTGWRKRSAITRRTLKISSRSGQGSWKPRTTRLASSTSG